MRVESRVYLIGLVGMWLLCDGIYSLCVHMRDSKQTFWKDHIFRWIRIAIGLALMLEPAL